MVTGCFYPDGVRLVGVTAALLAAVAAACGDGMTAAQPSASLTVTVWPQGKAEGGARKWTLRCNPTGGTHPAKARACRRLAQLKEPFKPVPRDAVCTEIYGGPHEARVTGTFRGKRVNASFNRRNGCQIARWDRVQVLLVVAGSN